MGHTDIRRSWRSYVEREGGTGKKAKAHTFRLVQVNEQTNIQTHTRLMYKGWEDDFDATNAGISSKDDITEEGKGEGNQIVAKATRWMLKLDEHAPVLQLD